VRTRRHALALIDVRPGQHFFQARAIVLGELEPRESRFRRHLKL
jgi:hypothetical protein